MANPVLVEVIRGQMCRKPPSRRVCGVRWRRRRSCCDRRHRRGRSSRARPSRRSRRCRWSKAARPTRTASGMPNSRSPAPRIPANRAMSSARPSMLARAGLDATALECGAHWPMRQDATDRAGALGRDRRRALHNNCSGKHAGFVCTCRHLGIDHRGYVGAGHRSQEMVREAMEAVTGAAAWRRRRAASTAARSPPMRCR